MTRPLDVVIVGAQKAGTTSLKAYLGQHPAVATHREREMMYFVSDEEYGQGWPASFRRYFGDAPAAAECLVAKSVGVMFHPAALARLANHDPAVRAIAVLRHPVDRAYSAYWYCRRLGWEDRQTFEEGLDAEAGRGLQGQPFLHTAYVERGQYVAQVRRLYRELGAERCLVMLFEDLLADPLGACREVFRFAGVDPGFVPDLSRRENPAGAARSDRVARVLSGRGPLKRLVTALVPAGWRRGVKQRLRALNEVPFEPPPMARETRARLLDLFAPSNRELAGLLGRSLAAWDQ